MANKKFIVGETVEFYVKFTDPHTNEQVDPSTANITIKDNVGTEVVDDEIMSKVVAEQGEFTIYGEYQYLYVSSDDAIPGKYVAIITADFAGKPVKDRIHFLLESED